jgi:cytochrome c peroxidase
LTCFQKAFGSKEISKKNIGKAIATFERTLLAKNSKFDNYAAGNLNALSPLELRGLSNFVSAGCNKCHSGPMFSDYKLHIMGHEDNPRLGESDKGDGKYGFRTPSLRNLSLTGPYMHNGVFKTLEEVMVFYEELSGAGGSRNKNIPTKQMDKILRPFGMTNDQIKPIVAFLKTLDDPNFDKTIPQTVPSGLNPGGNIK